MKAGKQVYIVLDVAIKDRGKFLEYVEGHKASMQQYGGRLLFRSNDVEAIEGGWMPRLIVVHEWTNEALFRAWYASPEYAPWKKLRKEAMDVNMTLARGMKSS